MRGKVVGGGRWRACLAVALVVMSSRQADAMCAGPNPLVLSPSAGEVPPRFTVFAFVRASKMQGALPAISLVADDGKAIPATVSLASRDQYLAFRIDADGPPGQHVVLTVRVANGFETKAGFTTTADWKPPEPRLAIGSVKPSSFAWECSSERAVILTLSREAIAYRVTWAKNEGEWKSGRRSSIVLPATPLAFWGRGDRSEGENQVRLGRLNCLGTVLPDLLAGPVFAAVAAIDEDGTESPASEPRLLTLPDEKSESAVP